MEVDEKMLLEIILNSTLILSDMIEKKKRKGDIDKRLAKMEKEKWNIQQNYLSLPSFSSKKLDWYIFDFLVI